MKWWAHAQKVASRLRLPKRAALVVAVVGLTASCSSGEPAATPIDFMGEVVAADHDDWEVDAGNPAIAFTTGGIDSDFRVGPATFSLADGSTLDVPADTPGGNVCSLLGFRDQPRAPTCLVVGQLDDSGAVDWFSIGPLDRRDDGTFMLSVDRFEGRDAIALVSGTWVSVPVPPDARLICSEPGDLTSTPIEVPSSSALVGLNADLDVASVECLYAE